MTPGPWTFVLVALAAYRTWKLVGDDSISEPWRTRLSGRALELVECPWCLGSWLAVGWSAAWLVWPHGVQYAAVPLAVAAAVGLLAQAVFALSSD